MLAMSVSIDAVTACVKVVLVVIELFTIYVVTVGLQVNTKHAISIKFVIN